MYDVQDTDEKWIHEWKKNREKKGPIIVDLASSVVRKARMYKRRVEICNYK